jgi:hypothetical protein
LLKRLVCPYQQYIVFCEVNVRGAREVRKDRERSVDVWK